MISWRMHVLMANSYAKNVLYSIRSILNLHTDSHLDWKLGKLGEIWNVIFEIVVETCSYVYCSCVVCQCWIKNTALKMLIS